MKIEKGRKVTLEFKLYDENNNLLDETTKGDELIFVFGEESTIVGLEEALLGKMKGDKMKVRVTPSKGYGNYDEELTQVMSKDSFSGMDIYEGMEFEADTDHGVGVFSIKEITEEEIIVDGNHPFAGMILNFTLKVIDVK
ncbi:MAG: FKBP-type peptidyl-prolyl cis-trans isomerase [Psychrilyobacter sp.]|nr:FKBP-type peptidyl-prolyl cis-trans isomerase [Psychrilyobacter sp.]